MKFVFNGIKTTDKKLVKGWFSFCQLRKVVTFYAAEYGTHKEIRETFKVQNDTDTMTDYFDKDRIVFNQGEEFYPEALKGAILGLERLIRKIEKRLLDPKNKRNEQYYLDEIKGKRQQINEIKALLK